jgi:hypothetical protein
VHVVTLDSGVVGEHNQSHMSHVNGCLYQTAPDIIVHQVSKLHSHNLWDLPITDRYETTKTPKIGLIQKS